MSEIIDNLKNSGPGSFQEELAKTYFSKSTSRENHFTQSVPPQKNNGTHRIAVIAGVVIFIALLVLGTMLLLNRVEINVNVYPGLTADSRDSKNSEEIYLNKNGEINKSIVKDVMFYGSSTRDSRWGREVTLSNEDASKKAAIGINLIGPVDMERNLLSFGAKGKTGGEDLRVALRDTGDNVCYSKINRLSGSWQPFIINIEQAKDLIDVNNISRIDFEINPDGEAAVSRSTVYFKNICFIKKGE